MNPHKFIINYFSSANLDAPLIIYKEKAVKKSGEIVKSMESAILKYSDDSIDSFDDGGHFKMDDDFDDVEQKVPPAVIIGVKAKMENETIVASAAKTATATATSTATKTAKTAKSAKMVSTASTSAPQRIREKKRKHKVLSSCEYANVYRH